MEEYLTRFYDGDPIFAIFFRLFRGMSFPQAIFLELQVLLWVLFTTLFLVLLNKRILNLAVCTLFGLIFIVEIHHLLHALLIRNYYPGLITSIPLLVLGYVYWRELIKEFYAQKN